MTPTMTQAALPLFDATTPGPAREISAAVAAADRAYRPVDFLPADAPRAISTAPPAARSTDPETSRAAAKEITASGSRQSQGDRVLDLVRRFPGSTYVELASLDRTLRSAEPLSARPLAPVQVMRRLADLAQRDITGAPCAWASVERGPERRCSIERRSMTTWWPRPPRER